jgi:hypothetical protein
MEENGQHIERKKILTNDISSKLLNLILNNASIILKAISRNYARLKKVVASYSAL